MLSRACDLAASCEERALRAACAELLRGGALDPARFLAALAPTPSLVHADGVAELLVRFLAGDTPSDHDVECVLALIPRVRLRRGGYRWTKTSELEMDLANTARRLQALRETRCVNRAIVSQLAFA